MRVRQAILALSPGTCNPAIRPGSNPATRQQPGNPAAPGNLAAPGNPATKQPSAQTTWLGLSPLIRQPGSGLATG